MDHYIWTECKYKKQNKSVWFLGFIFHKILLKCNSIPMVVWDNVGIQCDTMQMPWIFCLNDKLDHNNVKQKLLTWLNDSSIVIVWKQH